MVSLSVTAVIVVASVASKPGLIEALVDGRCVVEMENELLLIDETTEVDTSRPDLAEIVVDKETGRIEEVGLPVIVKL